MSDAPAGALRSLHIALFAALLAGLGLFISIPANTALSIGWFVVLCASLVVGLWLSMRNATKTSRAAGGPLQDPGVEAGANHFLSVVGHDLRQPLQAISLYAATLATHDLPDNSKQLVDGLETAAETLSMQFEEVMAIAKLEAGRLALDPKPIALDAILKSTVAAQLSAAHAKSLHLRYVSTRLRVHGDEPQLARAVERLVAHAIRTTEAGGILLGCRRRGDRVLIEVRDTSGGVPQELLGEMFRPFSQYGQRLPDRALGLVLAQRIVAHLGGSLTHRSWPTRGSVYTITLPRL